jgi:hypothetical protein
MQLKLPASSSFIGICLLCMGFVIETSNRFYVAQTETKTEWSLRKDANGIKIYTRDYPDSPVKEFLAITTCSYSQEKVIVIINDIERYPKWLRSCKSVEPIKNIKDSFTVNYVEISFPWPLSNRDGIWESTVKENGPVYYAEIKSRPELVPEKEGIVRMHNACGSWKVEKLTNGQVKITQQFFADPEGNIPAWVVNLFLVDGPYDTFMNLLTLLAEEP